MPYKDKIKEKIYIKKRVKRYKEKLKFLKINDPKAYEIIKEKWRIKAKKYFLNNPEKVEERKKYQNNYYKTGRYNRKKYD